jgi:putative transposase
MKTYTFKLYPYERNADLHHKINAAGVIWNHIVRLQLRHRSLFYPKDIKEVPEKWQEKITKIQENKQAKKYPGKPFSAYRVYNRLQGIRQKNASRLGHTLNELNTGAVQNITERLERAFKLFFTKLKKGDRKIEPVKTRNPRYYPSFTLKKNGYVFNWPLKTVTIMGQSFKFFDDRIPKGKIKTVTVKRDLLGGIFLYAVSDESEETKTRDPRPLVGMDVWLDPILTLSDGTKYNMPTFYQDKLGELRKLDKSLSKKKEAKKSKEKETGERTPPSGKYIKTRLQRARLFRDIVNKRREHHIQLARKLSQEYGTIAVPDVPIRRLAKRSGLRVGDLGYSLFLSWLQQECQKTGSVVLKLPGRYTMATTCHVCGHVLEKGKKPKKIWECPNCGTEHNREFNVAKNIEIEALKKLKLVDYGTSDNLK